MNGRMNGRTLRILSAWYDLGYYAGAATRSNAGRVIGYCQAWLATGDPIYEEKARRGLQYLLLLQEPQGETQFGAFVDDPSPFGDDGCSLTITIYSTAHAGAALVEGYLAFGDEEYYNAAINAAEWHMQHPAYPYTDLSTCLPYDPTGIGVPYSQVNIHGLQLWNLALVYSITGDQRYLDRCLELAEEIMAWQNYKDNQTYGDPPAPKCPWEDPYDDVFDGSWHKHDYSAIPPPGAPYSGPPCENPTWFIPDRRTCYHTFALRGLLKTLQYTGQQSLPGTTTLRNGVSFIEFRQGLIWSIIAATNYLIDHQETLPTSGSRFYGGYMEYKDHIQWWRASDDQLPPYELGVNMVTSAYGVETTIDIYEDLMKYNFGILAAGDCNDLYDLLGGVTENMHDRYSSGPYDSGDWIGQAMMPSWGRYLLWSSSGGSPQTLTLRNKSFEDREIVWELWSWDGEGVTISTVNPHSGNKCVHITDNSTSASKWAAQIVSASPGLGYKLEAYAHVLSGRNQLYLEFLDKDFQSLALYYKNVDTNTSYDKVTLTKTAPANTRYLRIWLYSPWYWLSEGQWDDVSLSALLQ